jgi:Domain of unknown function (DUF5911)
VVLLEEYGLIGDLESAALVGRNGAIDWLCLPLFDSASFFSVLLADEQHGRWLLAPAGEVTATARCDRPGTLVLENESSRLPRAARRGGVLGQRPFCVRSVVVAAPNVVGACDA